LIRIFPWYGEAFLRLFFPSVCALCGHLLELDEKGLCSPCGRGLQKSRLPPSEERIRIRLESASEGWALFRYEDSIKDLLHQIKFARRRDLIHLFDKDLADFLKRRPPLASYDLVIPIPLDRERRMEREFNQSGLLAKGISQILGIKLEPRALAKTRSTAAQSLLGREARRVNLDGVFRVPYQKRVRNRSVLLVDDIFTTGATIEEAARTLTACSVSRVGYLALARTPAP